MISENYKLVIKIINRFIQMGQKKTQRLVVLLYQTTIAIYNVFLVIRLFPLLKRSILYKYNILERVLVENIIPRNVIINRGAAEVDNHISRDDISPIQGRRNRGGGGQ